MTDRDVERRRRRRELALTAPADCDLSVLPVCKAFGHSLEGRVVVDDELEVAYLIGRCQRCGLGVMTDGTE